MSGPTVVQLACPDCGQELDGLEFDALYTCGDCALAWDPRERARYPLERLAGHDSGAGRIALPMWAFPATLEVVSGARPAALVAERVRERIRTLYVAAFALTREEYYGEPGLVWTRRQDAIPVAARRAGEPLAVRGIRRSEPVARRYVEPYLLQLVDEQADITGVELRASVGGPGRILVVPFLDQGTHLLDPVTGLGYPCTALEDLDGIRDGPRSSGRGKAAVP